MVNDDDFFEDAMEDHMDSMIRAANGAQSSAIELTKLVLQYSKKANFKMEEIFDTYTESFKVVMNAFSPSHDHGED